ncbi:MAG: MgtC/SapB family protein [Bacteroidales bacterium]|nr:MgtC/SapB family protein [Bacteroidales bacterium]
MTIDIEMALRLLAAGFLGAVIGYERELRSKGAGIRTHVLVALGAALFMIVSQYGFAGAARFDAARVAAGVVGGLGFLGGGIIMKNKHVVGLTTAAGIWVTGAIGLSAGCGLYLMAGLCTLLVLLCLEGLHFHNIRLGDREVHAVLVSATRDALTDVVASLGKQVTDFSLSRQGEQFKLDLVLRTKKKETPLQVLERLEQLPDIQIESLE